MTTETDLQRQIQLALTSPIGRAWRNSVGQGWQGKIVHQTPTQITLQHYRVVHFGLAPGSSDLIGAHTIEITPNMIGRRVAVFAAVEVKTPTGRLTDEQGRFIDTIISMGGIAGCARSVEQAISIVQSFSDRC